MNNGDRRQEGQAQGWVSNLLSHMIEPRRWRKRLKEQSEITDNSQAFITGRMMVPLIKPGLSASGRFKFERTENNMVQGDLTSPTQTVSAIQPIQQNSELQ